MSTEINVRLASATAQPIGSQIAVRQIFSHLRSKNQSPLEQCHSMRFRLSAKENADSIREKLQDLMPSLDPAFGKAASSDHRVMWTEKVPASHDSPIATRRRDSEMMRPLEATEKLPLRIVLLGYEGGETDLIIVARRSAFDFASLRLIAEFILGDREKPKANTPADALENPPENRESRDWEKYRDQLRKAEYKSKMDWALPDSEPMDRLVVNRFHMAGLGRIDFATAIAAVGLALGRYNGQTNPVVAAVSEPVTRPAGVIGGFENCVLVPIDGAALSVSELVHSIDEHLVHAEPRYNSELQMFLGTECEDGGALNAGVLFLEEPATLKEGKEVEYIPCQIPAFPITVVFRQGETPNLFCIVQQGAFGQEVIQRFAHSVAHIYRSLAAAPDTNPQQIATLSNEDCTSIARLGRSERPLEVSISRIESAFAECVRLNPEAPAISFNDEQLTYRELEQRANRAAHALRSLGVRAGHRVGICLDRSIELVVMMLAVLKAGGAYVPMDPNYPAERLAYTTADAEIGVVVTSMADFPVLDSVRVITPDGLFLVAVHDDGTAPNTDASHNDPAYVIYTSGSTGRPKGVVIPHRNVISLLAATKKNFQMTAADTWTMFHSSAFDFSVWEIWCALLTGAHLVVVPYWVSRSPEEFYDLLIKRNVTVLNQTPSAFAQLIEVDRRRAQRLPALRLVVFGGESLDTRMLLSWFDRHPEKECRLVNMFGITETTVHVTAETITRNESLAASKSVGKAIPGWHLYVMDQQGRILPPGVAGEIYVGGAGVALEYLNRPDLNTQRFVPDPYGGGVMYRSGDKGRLRLDGRLEHLGRLDLQIKLRGFRIELDEIRNVLLEAPSVASAAVVLAEEVPGDSATARLDAYVVLHGGDINDVRLHASRVLPEYMVPSTFTELPGLPLTANGKLDAKRLPAPTLVASTKSRVMPSSGQEKATSRLASAMLDLWSKTLGVPVGPDDNFFELGGNSLLAVRLAAAMREQNLPALPMRELYIHQTVRKLVSFFESQALELTDAP